ncbi:hypothetical protein KR76_00056 [Pimelobacter simplex]|uniref:Uncharacterized protein n=1 Tax=Nocardioides simplex TaxID=2045 RepID=A0A0C5XL30_NOCSI|nr:hypothetical protein KR76_00056 [Pimelobacter simplex]
MRAPRRSMPTRHSLVVAHLRQSCALRISGISLPAELAGRRR